MVSGNPSPKSNTGEAPKIQTEREGSLKEGEVSMLSPSWLSLSNLPLDDLRKTDKDWHCYKMGVG